MSARPIIFISAVSKEHHSLRSTIAIILHGLGYDTDFQEVLGTEQGDITEMLARHIDRCDGVLQLVGQQYGFAPSTPHKQFGTCSYTQFEALYARSLAKKVWYILLDPAHPHDVCELEASELQTLQAGYRQRITGDTLLFQQSSTEAETKLCIYQWRSDLDELRKQWRERIERQEQLANDSLTILRRMEKQLANLAKNNKPNDLPPEEMFRPVVSLEEVMLDVFVPIGIIGGITAYGGYSCILKSDYPCVAVLINKDYIDIQFDPDPELLRDVKQIYMLKQASALALPYQAILTSLSKRFNRTDFSTICIQFASLHADLPCPSVDLTSGTGDDYFEIEIYPTLTERAQDRSMSFRAVIEDPDFIQGLAGVILSVGMRALVVDAANTPPPTAQKRGGCPSGL
jgi:Domain of unknown function (DUF4062)